MLEFLFNKVVGLKACNLIKKRPQNNCFSVIIAKYLRTTFCYLNLVFYKQSVYGQLTLEWQIAKQLSGFNPLSLSNNRNYR